MFLSLQNVPSQGVCVGARRYNKREATEYDGSGGGEKGTQEMCVGARRYNTTREATAHDVSGGGVKTKAHAPPHKRERK
jgi:hypothetical protein